MELNTNVLSILQRKINNYLQIVQPHNVYQKSLSSPLQDQIRLKKGTSIVLDFMAL
jgi:hypothetical protein